MRWILLVFGSIIGCANAGPVTWYLHGVQYSDNGIGSSGYSSGQFTYDADTNLLTDWSIDDFGKPQNFFPSSWGPPPSCLSCVQSSTSIQLSGVDSAVVPFPVGHNNTLVLFLAQPLTDSGGTIALVPYDFSSDTGSIEFFHQGVIGQGIRYVEGGFVSTIGPTDTPEPSTLSVVVLSLISAATLKSLRAWSNTNQRP